MILVYITFSAPIYTKATRRASPKYLANLSVDWSNGSVLHILIIDTVGLAKEGHHMIIDAGGTGPMFQ